MLNQFRNLRDGRPLELVIFVGLQASGKTTFYKNYFEGTHRIISKDLMSKNAKHKSARQERMLNAELSLGHSVVLDNTNPTALDRTTAIRIAHRYGARVVAYFFIPDLPRNLKLNRVRAGRACVPDVAIYSAAKKLESPAYCEGFDEIWEVSLAPNYEFNCLKRSA